MTLVHVWLVKCVMLAIVPVQHTYLLSRNRETLITIIIIIFCILAGMIWNVRHSF